MPFDSRPSPSSKIPRNAGGAHFLAALLQKKRGDPHFLFNDFNKDNTSFR